MFGLKEKPLFDCVKKGQGVTPETGYHVKIKGKTVAKFRTYVEAQKFMLTNDFLSKVYEKL